MAGDGAVEDDIVLAAGGWRDGWLTYQDAPLGEIVEDIHRYYAPGVRISDPRLAAIRITASFHQTEIMPFLTSLDSQRQRQSRSTTTSTSASGRLEKPLAHSGLS